MITLFPLLQEKKIKRDLKQFILLSASCFHQNYWTAARRPKEKNK